MPVPPEVFYARVQAADEDDNRQRLSRMSASVVFPFAPEGLQVVPLAPPVLPEPPRHGEDAQSCSVCTPDRDPIWTDDVWRMRVSSDPTGAPLLLMVEPVEHVDLPGLSDERARELGLLIVHVVRAIESLPHIARAHVSRWGDGAAHLHVFVYARPAGFGQLRGTCLALWEDLLPPTPAEECIADGRRVAESLVQSYGGRVGG